MSEPTIYALPDEPEGPVWDRNGDKWERTGEMLRAHGREWAEWRRVASEDLGTWPAPLMRGPVTSTPPWKPEVGGTVETAEQYEAMPLGSIVACDQNEAWWLDVFGVWNSSFAKTNLAAPSTGATILRVGWEA